MQSLFKTNVLHHVLTGILGTTIVSCAESPKSDQVPVANPIAKESQDTENSESDDKESQNTENGELTKEESQITDTTTKNTPPQSSSLSQFANWQGVNCTNNVKDLFTNLNPTDSIDGLLLYTRSSNVPASFEVVGGNPCDNASDPISCNSQLETPPSLYTNALVTTQGDIVKILEDKAEIKIFLGNLDNPQKVFSWMHVHGMSLSCSIDRSATIASSNNQSWDAIFIENSSNCAPIVTDKVTIEINAMDGTITEKFRQEIDRIPNVCIGRKPPGTIQFENTLATTVSLGRDFAKHAAYETASVIAFNHLYEELKKHKAPEKLLKRIRKAANDECFHASQVAMLARRYGEEPLAIKINPAPIRDLLTIAIDNMREGYIGESWGALIGLYQAEHAQDPVIATTMKRVAIDEIDHASLSWEIHDWIYPQLDVETHHLLNLAKIQSIQKIKNGVCKNLNPYQTTLAGMPEPHMMSHLISQFEKTLS